ncbi:MAG: serine protease Do [Sneathiella sp.]|jgi:serine protease Do
MRAQIQFIQAHILDQNTVQQYTYSFMVKRIDQIMTIRRSNKIRHPQQRLAAFVNSLISGLAIAVLLGNMAQAQDQKTVPNSRSEITLSFAPLVKRASPAVVNIFTKKTVVQAARPSLFSDPFFEQFFGPGIRDKKSRKRTQSSLGSGVIVNPDGTIVTNYHVIAGADEITVALQDRREFDATLVLEDERTDLAVLRIDAENEQLPFLEFRDSDDLEVGDLVLAIGNPFGVGQTVTTGIISALGRSTGVRNDIRSFIQTDAAINPGNSGGALLTMDGKIAGINSAIFSKGGGSLGIGFAIPANLVQSVLSNGLATGQVIRPWLGAEGQTVTRDVAEGLGLKRTGGVLINNVYADSAADVGKLETGDVILAVDGHEVLDPQALLYRISTGIIGKKAIITVFRNGQEIDLAIPLMTAPEKPARDIFELTGQQPLAGAVVGNLSPAYALEIGIPVSLKGVIVSKVKKGSIAARYNIRPGDIITSVNAQKVNTNRQLQTLLNDADGRWIISLVRKGRTLTFQVSS